MANNDEFEFIEGEVNENQKKKSLKPSKRQLSTEEQQMTPTGDKSAAGSSGAGGSGSAAKKQKRGKQFRDQNAPRMPLNGYVRFLNANRERVKTANPSKSFADITKLLAAEWSALDPEQKRQYLDEAEKAKEQYLKELHEYQRTEAYQEFQQKQKQRKDMKLKAIKEQNSSAGDGQTPAANTSKASAMTGSSAHNINANDENIDSFPMDGNQSTLDLPIFTEEFLEHNRVREQELRSLRRLNTEYEEQNAILSKHIDNMKSAIEKLEVESVQQKNNNAALNQHLQHLRTTLLKSFASIAVPGSNETPTPDTIDDYMIRLHQKLTAKDRNRETEVLFDRVRGIVAGLDYTLH